MIPILLLCFTAGCFQVIHMDNMKIDKVSNTEESVNEEPFC